MQIYRNLHKARWSVRDKGRVIDHAVHTIATGIRLHVGESTRQRALAKKQRSVHAWAVCDHVGVERPARPADGMLRYSWHTGHYYDQGGNVLPSRLQALEFCGDGSVYYWGIN